MSIWDKFVNRKGVIQNGDTGKVAMDFYHSYSKDIPLFFKSTGINTYDATLAWTRILPTGTEKTPNKAGIEYYRNVAKAVHAQGGKFTATLYHWDLPQTLQDKYKGWLSPKIVADFEHYARTTIEALGDVVDDWVSMNEPRTFCTEGYAPDPESAPGYKGKLMDQYYCVHHALLAHTKAHQVWKDLKAKGKAKGRFGIKIDGGALIPYHPNDPKDKAAALRGMDFTEAGWLLGPLSTGDYPPVIRETLGNRLPRFTKAESAALKTSFDLVYYDSYTSAWAKHVDNCTEKNENWPSCVATTQERPDGTKIGLATGSDWNFIVPNTTYDVLNYAYDRWHIKNLAVGETGIAIGNSHNQTLTQKLHDHLRIQSYRWTLKQLDWILQEGKINLEGFVFWSCIANFEWSNGYQADFGVIAADPGKNKPRHPKQSAFYLRDVFRRGLQSDSMKWG